MKYLTKIALSTLCCGVMSGCMITRNAMTIGERYEQVSLSAAYMLDNDHVLLRSEIEICKNIATLGSFNHDCKNPFYRDSIWKLPEDKNKYTTTKNSALKNNTQSCSISIRYIGEAVEVITPATIKFDVNDLTKLNFLGGRLDNAERMSLLCSGFDNLFATDTTHNATLYLYRNDVYKSYKVDPKIHDVQDNLLVAVRYIILPVAFALDIITGPIQLFIVATTPYGPGR